MAEVARKIRVLGTAVLVAAAAISLAGESVARPRRHTHHAPAPLLRPELNEGLTSAAPPIPVRRPAARRSNDVVGPPAPMTKPRPEEPALNENLTSEQAPIPEPRPDTAPDFIGPPAPAKKARPREPALSEELTSEQPPIPEPRPGTARSPDFIGPPAPVPPAVKPPPPRPAVPQEQMAACLAELERLDVAFTRQTPITDPIGCAVQNPVVLKDLGKAVKLTPEALLDCPMALAAVRFMDEVVTPEAKRDLGADLTAINQASGYVCRPRNGTTTLSEHAYGNALDIAGFSLADGRHVEVRAGAPEAEQKFLDAVRKAACGPFKTVLGPGSDADHALHFHFDLEPRRNGSTFCQ